MRAVLFAVLIVVLAHPVGARAGPAVADGFEAEALDPAAWMPKDVRYGDGEGEPQLTLTADDSRCGARAARVMIAADDPGRACDGCQRAEVWQAPGVRPRWGEETWVGFSVKLSGGAGSGSMRTVVGQWKTPSDRSPFLAERYDNRVFHLTIDTVDRLAAPGAEPASVRRTIACSVGNPEDLVALQALLATRGPDRRSVAEAERLRDAALARLAAGDYAPAAETAEGSAPNRLGSYLPEFACIQDPSFYMRPARVSVALGEAPVLPDPGADWVDLQFGIRTGHQDSTVGPTEGRIEVWADGRHAVTMTGDLDAPLHAGEGDRSVYFKFGVYRAADARTDMILIDEFRQGTSREEVVPSCPRP